MPLSIKGVDRKNAFFITVFLITWIIISYVFFHPYGFFQKLQSLRKHKIESFIQNSSEKPAVQARLYYQTRDLYSPAPFQMVYPNSNNLEPLTQSLSDLQSTINMKMPDTSRILGIKQDGDITSIDVTMDAQQAKKLLQQLTTIDGLQKINNGWYKNTHSGTEVYLFFNHTELVYAHGFYEQANRLSSIPETSVWFSYSFFRH